MRLWPSTRLPMLLVLSMCLGASTWFRPDRALHVATGAVAHDLCSETFVSGLDPDQTFAESLAPRPGLGLIRWGMRYDVDRARKQVQATFVGGFRSRAVFRDRVGCVLVYGPHARAATTYGAPRLVAGTPYGENAETAPVETTD